MTKPRLLDLFCCQGGASKGYADAGFEVVGVDLVPQPRYPFEFIQANALTFDLTGFDAVHASPPCQKYSAATRHLANDKPRLLDPLRARLIASGLPYVIENTPGAPLLDPALLCGLAFPELRVKRHRLFESNVPLVGSGCGDHSRDYFVIFGHECRDRRHGHAAGRKNKLADGQAAMGIDWMTRGGLSEAIPPAYTRFVGAQLIAALRGKEGQR